MSDKQKHTPGPWTAVDGYGIDSPSGMVVRLEVAEASLMAYVEVSDADASLIAAAPDLLAALENAVRGGPNYHAEARAAIAKARGQSEELAP
jgi:hypothetical protein